MSMNKKLKAVLVNFVTKANLSFTFSKKTMRKNYQLCINETRNMKFFFQ